MTRKINSTRGVFAGAVVLMLMLGLGLGGCTDQTLQTQNSQLIKQNQQLAQQLADAKANLAASRQQLQQQQQIAAAAQQAAAQPTPAPQNAGAAGTGNGMLPEFNNAPSASGHSNMMSRRHRMMTHRSARSRTEIRRFVLSSDVLFRSGSARLQFRAEHALLRLAHVLRTRYSGRRIRIEGYTDNRPIHHPYPNNYALGLARSRSVEVFLAHHGVSRHRMTAISFGDHHMISRTNLAKDRRVEIVVLR